MKTIIPIFVLLAICTSSCKKYPEGPGISLRSKTKRLVNKWTIEEGSTIHLNFGPEIFSYEFENDGAFIYEVELDTASTQSIEGTWEFSSDKSQVITHLPEFGWRQLVFNATSDTLTIERLKKTQLWFTSSSNGTKKLIPYQ